MMKLYILLKIYNMNKVEKKLLNKVFNDYIYNYCFKNKNIINSKEHKIVGDICDFMKKYKI